MYKFTIVVLALVAAAAASPGFGSGGNHRDFGQGEHSFGSETGDGGEEWSNQGQNEGQNEGQSNQGDQGQGEQSLYGEQEYHGGLDQRREHDDGNEGSMTIRRRGHDDGN